VAHDVVIAAAEITHARGFPILERTAGLESNRGITAFVMHDGEGADASRGDSFALVHDESETPLR
jgi:hypothetical protein